MIFISLKGKFCDSQVSYLLNCLTINVSFEFYNDEKINVHFYKKLLLTHYNIFFNI